MGETPDNHIKTREHYTKFLAGHPVLIRLMILEMLVSMDCPGCESKVKKALQKLDGVNNDDIDMDLQKVTVTGWADKEKILKGVRKTGKKADPWPLPSNIPEYTSTEYFYNLYNYHSDTSSYFSSDHSSVDHLYEHHSEQGYYDNGQQYDQYEYGHGSYNYNSGREYDGGYYINQRPGSSSILGGRSNTMFSDENVNACSIM